MSSSNLKPGSLLKVSPCVIPTGGSPSEIRFYHELQDDIQWDGKSKIYGDDILIYLGSEMVRFSQLAHVFSSSQGKTGYAALQYLSDLK